MFSFLQWLSKNVDAAVHFPVSTQVILHSCCLTRLLHKSWALSASHIKSSSTSSTDGSVQLVFVSDSAQECELSQMQPTVDLSYLAYHSSPVISVLGHLVPSCLPPPPSNLNPRNKILNSQYSLNQLYCLKGYLSQANLNLLADISFSNETIRYW